MLKLMVKTEREKETKREENEFVLSLKYHYIYTEGGAAIKYYQFRAIFNNFEF